MDNYRYRGKTHHQEASEKAMDLWEHNAYLYRTYIPRYHKLVEAKAKLGIKGKGSLLAPKTLDSYPDIPFFNITDRRAAADYIDSLPKAELDQLLHSLKSKECGLANPSYIAVKDKVYDLDYMIRRTIKKQRPTIN